MTLIQSEDVTEIKKPSLIIPSRGNYLGIKVMLGNISVKGVVIMST